MPDLLPADPAFDIRIRESFARQQLMATLGAALAHVAPGRIHIALPFAAHITQQHGVIHAGAIASIADSACGYAALSLMPPDAAVLSIEFKLNLLSPAHPGRDLLARGHVVRAGRTVTVCTADVASIPAGTRLTDPGPIDGEIAVATMLGTMMSVRDRAGFSG